VKNLSQDTRSPGRDMNLVLPEYEAGVLTTRPRRFSKVQIHLLLKQLVHVFIGLKGLTELGTLLHDTTGSPKCYV
jgi:hypothetical protein